MCYLFAKPHDVYIIVKKLMYKKKIKPSRVTLNQNRSISNWEIQSWAYMKCLAGLQK